MHRAASQIISDESLCRKISRDPSCRRVATALRCANRVVYRLRLRKHSESKFRIARLKWGWDVYEIPFSWYFNVHTQTYVGHWELRSLRTIVNVWGKEFILDLCRKWLGQGMNQGGKKCTGSYAAHQSI